MALGNKLDRSIARLAALENLAAKAGSPDDAKALQALVRAQRSIVARRKALRGSTRGTLATPLTERQSRAP